MNQKTKTNPSSPSNAHTKLASSNNELKTLERALKKKEETKEKVWADLIALDPKVEKFKEMGIKEYKQVKREKRKRQLEKSYKNKSLSCAPTHLEQVPSIVK